MAMNQKLLRPRASGFNPKQISGLYLWLNGSDSSSVTLNSGNVSEWRDMSGGGRHFAQATSAAQPVYSTAAQNGKNCLTFDASRRLLSSSAASTWAFLHDGALRYDVFVVCKTAVASTTLRAILATGSSARNLQSLILWHDHRAGQNNSVYYEVTSLGLGTAGYVAAETIAAQSSGVLRRIRISGDLTNATVANRLVGEVGSTDGTSDTVATGTASSGDPTFTLAIGSLAANSQSFGFSGDICEIVIFSRATNLTTAERASINAYLNKKWGL
jgi:hypothetical protein